MSSRKPWYRLRNMILLVMLAIIALIASQVWFAYAARPGPPIDFHAQAQARLDTFTPRPGNAENGWHWFADATEAYQAVDEQWRAETPDEDGTALDITAWTDAGAERPRGLDFYTTRLQQRGAFDNLERFRTAAWVRRPPQQGMLLEILLPDLAQARGLARLHVSLMTLEFLADQDAQALPHLDTMLAIAQAYTHQAWLIEHLVGYAIAHLGLQRTREVMAVHDLDADTLAALREILDRRTPLGSPAIAFEGERMMLHDFIQRTHTDNGKGDGRFLLYEFQRVNALGYGVGGPQLPGAGAGRLLNLSHIAFPSKRTTLTIADDLYDRYVEAATMPRLDRLANPPITDADIEQLVTDKRNLILSTLMPALGAFVSQHDAITAQVHATRLMLAIEQHRAATGEPPAALTDLVPRFLDELPTDPYSTDGFRYRRLNAGETHFGCRNYILYTIGADGVDDNGVPPLASEFDDDGKEREFVSQSRALIDHNTLGDYLFNLPFQP